MNDNVQYGSVQHVVVERDVISDLSQVALQCLQNARNGDFSEAQRQAFNKRGKRLMAIIQLLVDEEFSKLTADFQNINARLAKVNTAVSTELAQLEQDVKNIEFFNQCIVLLDQIIQIAAGLAKLV